MSRLLGGIFSNIDDITKVDYKVNIQVDQLIVGCYWFVTHLRQLNNL